MYLKFDQTFLNAFEEFKNEVDSRIKSLGDRIGDMDRRFDDKIKLLDSLEKNKDSYKEYVDKSHNLLCDKLDTLKNMFATHCNELSETRTYFREQLKKVELLDASVADLLSTLNKVKADQQDQLSKLVSLQVSTESNKQECKVLSNSIGFLSSTVTESDDEISQQLKILKCSVQSILEAIHSHKASCSKNEADIEELNSFTKQISKTYAESKDQILNEIKENKRSLTDLIDAELAEIFIPDVSHFVKENDLKDLRHEIDLSNLDARNAYAKASNIEMQTSIHAKKIDSIQLKINQMEINRE